MTLEGGEEVLVRLEGGVRVDAVCGIRAALLERGEGGERIAVETRDESRQMPSKMTLYMISEN